MNMFEFRTSCEQIETLIFNNEFNFLDRFSSSNESELINVSFSSNRIYFVFILHNGQHIGNHISWTDFHNWKNNLPQ